MSYFPFFLRRKTPRTYHSNLSSYFIGQKCIAWWREACYHMVREEDLI
jgi:hypothetical protein